MSLFKEKVWLNFLATYFGSSSSYKTIRPFLNFIIEPKYFPVPTLISNIKKGFLFFFFSLDNEESYEAAPVAEAPAAEYYYPAAEESPPAADAIAPAADAALPAADAMEPPAYLPDPGDSKEIYRGRKDSFQYVLCQQLEFEIKSEETSVDTSDEGSVNSFNSKVERYNGECTGRWR